MRRVLALTLVVVGGCGTEASTGDAPPPLRLEEVGRFGSQDEAGAALTAVAGVLPSGSSVLVLESTPPRVAVFSMDGEWQGEIGREGDGPGELRGPTALGVRGGLIWVADQRGARLEFFRPDGTAERSERWTVPADPEGSAAIPWAPLADGTFLAAPSGVPFGALFRGEVDHRSYFRVSAGGADSKLIYREEIVPSDFGSADVSGRQAVVLHPHPQAPLVRVDPLGRGLLVVTRRNRDEADGPAFRVQRIDAEGEVQQDWRFPYTPISADGWRDRFRTQFGERMQEQSGTVDQALLSAIDDALSDIGTLPPITDAVPGEDGSFWLRREDTGATQVGWELYSGEGALIGRTVLSEAATILRVSAEEVWAVEPDEYDVPYVVRYRVVR